MTLLLLAGAAWFLFLRDGAPLAPAPAPPPQPAAGGTQPSGLSSQDVRAGGGAVAVIIAGTPLAPLAPVVGLGIAIGQATQKNAPSTRLFEGMTAELRSAFAAWVRAGNVDPSWTPDYTASVRAWAAGVP